MIVLDEAFAKMFLYMEDVCFSEGLRGSNDPLVQKRHIEVLLQIKEKFPELAKKHFYLYSR